MKTMIIAAALALTAAVPVLAADHSYFDAQRDAERARAWAAQKSTQLKNSGPIRSACSQVAHDRAACCSKS